MKKYLAFDIGASSGRSIVGYLKDDVIFTKELSRFDNGMIQVQGRYHWDIFRLFEEFKRGIINFPTLYHGRKVFLCWHPGEDRVSHWHELDETFSDRAKIKDESDFLLEKPSMTGHSSS